MEGLAARRGGTARGGGCVITLPACVNALRGSLDLLATSNPLLNDDYYCIIVTYYRDIVLLYVLLLRTIDEICLLLLYLILMKY